MHLDKKAEGSTRTTVQLRSGVGLPTVDTGGEKITDKRALKHSSFMITINTNMSVEDDKEADEWAIKFSEVLDGIGFNGATCRIWGNFFRVNTGSGKKWLNKKGTVPNPKHNPDYNSYYEEDDKQGLEFWCSLIERLVVVQAGVEWAPGTKKGKNQYLHAHIFVKLSHRTRLLVHRENLAKYMMDEMGLPWLPYVHVDVVRDNTSKVIDYIMKNAWNKNSDVVRDRALQFFTDGE